MHWSCFKQFTSCLSSLLSLFLCISLVSNNLHLVCHWCRHPGVPLCGWQDVKIQLLTVVVAACWLLTLSVVVCTVELNAAPSTTGQQARTGGQLGQSSETVPIKAPAPMWRCSRIMHMQRELHPTILASLEGCVDQVSALMVPPCPPPPLPPDPFLCFDYISLLWYCALFVL